MGSFIPPLSQPGYLTERGYSYHNVTVPTWAVGANVLDVGIGDLFAVTMPNGDSSFFLANPRIGAYRLAVSHAADGIQYALTFPTGFFAGQPGPLAYAYTLFAGATKKTIFDMYFDGTNWHFTPLPMSV